jgi:hypothetical protein
MKPASRPAKRASEDASEAAKLRQGLPAGFGAAGRKVAREQAISKRLQEQNLPTGWKVATSKRTGRTYYYNKSTGAKSFTRPSRNPVGTMRRPDYGFSSE